MFLHPLTAGLSQNLLSAEKQRVLRVSHPLTADLSQNLLSAK